MEEAETAFLRTRRLGIYGAHRKATPRTIEAYQAHPKLLSQFMRSRQITNYNQATEQDFLDSLAGSDAGVRE